MSSSKVKRLSRQLNFTSTWVGGVLTVTVIGSPHLLANGDTVDLLPASSRSEPLLKQVVNVTGAYTFTISYPDHEPFDFARGLAVISFVRTGFTGRIIFTAPKSTGAASVVQSFVTGVGGATYLMEGSLDGVHWTPLTGVDVVHAAVDGNTQATQISANWAYLAANVSVIGANTKLEALYSA